MADQDPDASDVERGPLGNDPQRWVARPSPEPQHRQEDGDAEESDEPASDDEGSPEPLP